MADDDNVVFENSPLYGHLQDLGFSTDDVEPEARCSSKIVKEVSNGDIIQVKEECAPSEGGNVSVVQRLKTYLMDYIFDEGWLSQVSHLYAKSSRQLVEDVTKNPVVCEEDAVYVESFAASCGSDQREDGGDGIMGQMLTQIGVLTVTMAYGFFRMFYMKQPEFAAGAYVYVLDVLSVAMTIVALMPAALKFATIGRLVNQLHEFNTGVSEMLKTIGDVDQRLSKAVLFVQETEVIHRGYTLVTAPVARLELGIMKNSPRQCSELRRTIYRQSRKVMVLMKSVSKELLQQFPSHVELEDLSSYLAHVPLEEYGPPINIPDDQLEKLLEATDDYCLTSLKVMANVASAHVSEFLRILCVLCVVQASEPKRTNVSGYADQLKLVQNVSTTLTEYFKQIDKSYFLHKNMQSEFDARQKRSEKSTYNLSDSIASKAARKAVRSLRLHLQAATQRIQAIDDLLDCDTDGRGANNGELLDVKSQSELFSEISYVRSRLTACSDCCEEADKQLSRLGLSTVSAKPTGLSSSCEKSKSADDCNSPVANLPMIPNCQPVTVDQVFEGYPDNTEGENDHVSSLLTEEEKKDQKEALRVLSELKAVIAVRAKETSERERIALLRQNPDYKFTEDVPVSSVNVTDCKQSRFGSRSELQSSSVEDADECLSDQVEADQCVHPNEQRQSFLFSSASNAGDSYEALASDCLLTRRIALLAIAKSKQMEAMQVETYEADADSDKGDSNDGDSQCDSIDAEDEDDVNCSSESDK